MPTLPEWLIILYVVFLVFMAGRMGAVGDAVGRALHGEPPPEAGGEDD